VLGRQAVTDVRAGEILAVALNHADRRAVVEEQAAISQPLHRVGHPVQREQGQRGDRPSLRVRGPAGPVADRRGGAARGDHGVLQLLGGPPRDGRGGVGWIARSVEVTPPAAR